MYEFGEIGACDKQNPFSTEYEVGAIGACDEQDPCTTECEVGARSDGGVEPWEGSNTENEVERSSNCDATRSRRASEPLVWEVRRWQARSLAQSTNRTREKFES